MSCFFDCLRRTVAELLILQIVESIRKLEIQTSFCDTQLTNGAFMLLSLPPGSAPPKPLQSLLASLQKGYRVPTRAPLATVLANARDLGVPVHLASPILSHVHTLCARDKPSWTSTATMKCSPRLRPATRSSCRPFSPSNLLPRAGVWLTEVGMLGLRCRLTFSRA